MRFYLVLTIIAISFYLVLKPNGSSTSADGGSGSVAQDISIAKEEPTEPASSAGAVAAVTNLAAPTAAPVADSSALGGRNIGLMLNKLTECTEIKNVVPTGSVEPTVASILDSVQPELGEPVIRSEDWNTTEITLADGSKRVIKIETVYEDDDIVKRLKHYQVSNQTLVPLELTNEQAVNPSETFLASLEKEGSVTSRERSERVFFQNGEEVTYTERDGKLVNSEVIRAGKSLKCSDYGQPSFKCQCF